MTKAVLLDLGNVIVGLDFDRAYQAVERLCPFRAEEIPIRIRATGLSERYEKGRISNQEFYREFCGALEMDISYEGFCRLWGDMFQPLPLLSERLLLELREQRRLLLLSNTNEIHFHAIQLNYPLVKHFDDYILSYQVGAMKPDRAIYEEAVRRSGCEPLECFFTDDDASNVQGAQEAGIDAVLFRGELELRTQLRARGIEAGRNDV